MMSSLFRYSLLKLSTTLFLIYCNRSPVHLSSLKSYWSTFSIVFLVGWSVSSFLRFLLAVLKSKSDWISSLLLIFYIICISAFFQLAGKVLLSRTLLVAISIFLLLVLYDIHRIFVVWQPWAGAFFVLHLYSDFLVLPCLREYQMSRLPLVFWVAILYPWTQWLPSISRKSSLHFFLLAYSISLL